MKGMSLEGRVLKLWGHAIPLVNFTQCISNFNLLIYLVKLFGCNDNSYSV